MPSMPQTRTRFIHTTLALGLLVVTSVQGFFICRYLERIHPMKFYFWLIGDVCVILLFFGALVLSARHLGNIRFSGAVVDMLDFNNAGTAGRYFGELPLGYVSWLLYSSLLLSRVAVIYSHEIPSTLQEKDFFGPRTLHFSIGLCSVVFYLLVEGHNYSTRKSERYHLVSLLCEETCIELLDTVSLLSELHDQEASAKELREFSKWIIAFCCLNFLLPAIYFYRLGTFNFSNQKFSLGVTYLYNVLHLLILDIPYLVLRLYMWIVFRGEMSVFFLRSVITGTFMLRNVYDNSKDVYKIIIRNEVQEQEHSLKLLPPRIRENKVIPDL